MAGCATPIMRASSRTVKPSIESQQGPEGQEQQERLLKVALEVVPASAAFGQKSKRDAHQGVEGRLNGAQIKGTAREEKESQRNHQERAISPRGSPAFRLRRASARAIRPPSRS